MNGFEAVLLGKTSGIGLFGRLLTGDVGPVSGTHVREGGLLLGSHSFRLDVGYAERLGALADTTYRNLRGGFTSTSDFGTSGIAVRLKGAYFLPLDRFQGNAKKSMGWEGETAVTYTWDRFPVMASLGYRLERMHDMPRDQEVSALVFGIGIWLKP